jgi:hypothetical protein
MTSSQIALFLPTQLPSQFHRGAASVDWNTVVINLDFGFMGIDGENRMDAE